jgi:hypothetical protein
MTGDGTHFTIDEAIAVQKGLRRELGLGEELFPMEAFVGMISDEIEKLRAHHKSDAQIADLVAELSGKVVSPEDIAQYYAAPELRGK